MANAGQAILTVVGAAAGAVAGFYTQNYELIGLGASLGNLVGQLAFPVKPNVTGDTKVMGASEGDPIKTVYGTMRVAGEVIWANPIYQGGGSGKGVGSTPSGPNFYQSFAVLLCEGPIVGIRRMWFDGVLVLDQTEGVPASTIAANQALLNLMAIYLGTETQMPDPTMQSLLGTNNVPAHRGTAYIVFTELNVTVYGPRIPNVECEVVQSGSAPTINTTLYSAGILIPWNQTSNDPRNSSGPFTYIDSNLTVHTGTAAGEYVYSTSDGHVINGTLAACIADTGASNYITWQYPNVPAGCNWLAANTPSSVPLYYLDTFTPYTVPLEIPAPLDVLSIYLHYNALNPVNAPAGTNPIVPYAGAPYQVPFATAQFGDSGPYWWCGPTSQGECDTYLMQKYTVDDGEYPAIGPGIYNGTNFINTGGTPEVYARYAAFPTLDQIFTCTRVIQPPPNNCNGYPSVPGTDFCVINGEVEQDYTWSQISGSFMQLCTGSTGNMPYQTAVYPSGAAISIFSEFTGIMASGSYTATGYTQEPCGPVVPTSDPRNNQSWWEQAYNLAVENGLMQAGKVYGTDYPKAVSSCYSATITSTPLTPTAITVGTAVAAICESCGLTSEQIDVSQLTMPLWGYEIARVTTGRDAIAPLQSYGFFDAALSTTGVLRFVQRGGAAVATITQENIGAYKGKPQKNFTRLSTPRTADTELPQTVRVKFANTFNDYQVGMQPAQRLITDSKKIVDVDLSAIAMAPSLCAQIADVILRTTWIGREEPDFTLDAYWLGIIQSGDPVNMNINGEVRRVRITDFQYSWPGLLTLKSTRDELDAYSSIFVGATTGTSGTAGDSVQSLGVAGPTTVIPLDIPAIDSDDNSAGYRVAVQSYLDNWSSATVYRSTDGGQTFVAESDASTASTTGTITNTLGNWKPGWDPVNTITLNLTSGTAPASVSLTSLYNSDNLAAIGANGRWEVIQFQNATLNGDGTYTLQGLIRGLLGTDFAMGQGQVGDTFVLLSGSTLRISGSLSTMGTTEQLKGVTSGDTVSTAAATTQVPQEVSLTPLAPICFFAGRDAAGDVIASWVRQDRFPNDLVDGIDVPMSEATELYSMDIYSSSAFTTIVRTINGITSPTTTYTAAQQIADFGSLQSAVYAEVYQVSAAVGRGYGRQATL